MLSTFSGYLATKFISLSNEPSMVRPTFIDLNSIESNYCPFVISLYKWNESWNAVECFQ